jgi:putative transposon-encoded protein
MKINRDKIIDEYIKDNYKIISEYDKFMELVKLCKEYDNVKKLFNSCKIYGSKEIKKFGNGGSHVTLSADYIGKKCIVIVLN